MLLSRARSGEDITPKPVEKGDGDKLPKVEDFLGKGDFVGALTLLEFLRSIKQLKTTSLIPYCCFHLGDYKRALQEYQALAESKENLESSGLTERDLALNMAACYFSMAMYKEAKEKANAANDCHLKTRLLLHLAQKEDDEDTLMAIHGKLEETVENQLSLASIHYLRMDFQSSIDIYKRILLDNRDFLALNVYVALCYHRLEYYDVSQEVLAVYLQNFPGSPVALNLKACNTFRLYSGLAAEKDLKPLLNIMAQEEESKHGRFSSAYDLIRHNLVVFRGGEGALQVLPKMVNLIPEAKLNLIIYYLHNEDLDSAWQLMKDTTPKTVPETILFAIVNCLRSYGTNNRECANMAQSYYNRIGSSEAEHDSVFGRLCMASAYFLSGNFDHCVLYLNSVRTHYYNDDTFNFNFAQAKGMLNHFEEAEELLLMIQSEKIKNDFVYVQWLARCYIMNKKPRLAWELYERMDTSPESFQLLQLIANESYRMGQFYYAAKAFDMLEKFESTQENWEGKRGACVGVFQLIIAGQEPKESLPDIVTFLRNSSKPNAEKILSVIKKWAKDNRINL